MQETDEEVCSSHLPRATYLARRANRTREKLHPKEPEDLDFMVNLDYVGHDFLQEDIRIDDQRHLVFATKDQLELLAGAKIWCVDATFKVVRQPFVQLFSIHCFLRKDGEMKQVPLAFALMSSRRTRDYAQVFAAVRDCLPGDPKVEEIIADFEVAIWNAAKDILPDVSVRGCNFHWTQAVYRKVQEVGLQTAYQKDDSVHRWIRKVMALPFLPREHIRPSLKELHTVIPEDGPLRDLFDYVYTTWFNSTVWKVRSWCVYRRLIRTNNDCERWHRRFNAHSHDAKLPFYLLVSRLRDEAKIVVLQAKQVENGKLSKYQRKQYRQLQGRVIAIWEDYSASKISASQLLRRIAAFSGPAVADS